MAQHLFHEGPLGRISDPLAVHENRYVRGKRALRDPCHGRGKARVREHALDGGIVCEQVLQDSSLGNDINVGPLPLVQDRARLRLAVEDHEARGTARGKEAVLLAKRTGNLLAKNLRTERVVQANTLALELRAQREPCRIGAQRRRQLHGDGFAASSPAAVGLRRLRAHQPRKTHRHVPAVPAPENAAGLHERFRIALGELFHSQDRVLARHAQDQDDVPPPGGTNRRRRLVRRRGPRRVVQSHGSSLRNAGLHMSVSGFCF